MRERKGREIKGGPASCWNLQVMARALGREVTRPDLFKRVTLAVVWKIDYKRKRRKQGDELGDSGNYPGEILD